MKQKSPLKSTFYPVHVQLQAFWFVGREPSRLTVHTSDTWRSGKSWSVKRSVTFVFVKLFIMAFKYKKDTKCCPRSGWSIPWQMNLMECLCSRGFYYVFAVFGSLWQVIGFQQCVPMLLSSRFEMFSVWVGHVHSNQKAPSWFHSQMNFCCFIIMEKKKSYFRPLLNKTLIKKWRKRKFVACQFFGWLHQSSLLTMYCEISRWAAVCLCVCVCPKRLAWWVLVAEWILVHCMLFWITVPAYNKIR